MADSTTRADSDRGAEAAVAEASPNDTPIAVKGVKKSFGSQVVLDGVDLTVRHGETLVVLGQSGTGKSVLLKLIIGLEVPDAGSIEVAGRDVSALARESDRKELNQVRQKMGFVFQQGALYDSLSVGENIDFPLARLTTFDEAKRRDRVREILKSVGMERDIDKMPSEISGGMQRRVGLARALALDPEIVLYDEPTAGLDPITADDIDHLIVKLKQERHVTSILVTHDIHAVRQCADRVVMLREGKVVLDGSVEDLEKSKDEFIARFLKTAA